MARRRTKKQSLEEELQKSSRNSALPATFFLLLIVFAGALYMVGFSSYFTVKYDRADAAAAGVASTTPAASPPAPTLNLAAYNAKLLAIANDPLASEEANASSTASSTVEATPTKKPLWPVSTVYPLAGALLPFNRIVAYYGNFYSTQMGVLGASPPQEMLSQLMATVQQWQTADPSTPVIPGIDYIAVTAQGSPGADGKYRFRMPASQVDEAISLANQVHGVVILDVQVGLSTVETEVPLLAPYLDQSNVELALDPEFAMHNGQPPGTVIGSLDASDINWAANYLASLVTEHNLPPKILVVHRFTQDMVTNYQDIQPLPQVQIVMDMDGWGSQPKKLNTYTQFIEEEPVQFTGFKLFYKNDLKPPSTGMLTPTQILNLTPNPSFIQYQ